MDFATRARHLVYLPQSLPAAVHLRVFESVLVAARASQPKDRRRICTGSTGCWSGWASLTWRCATWTPCRADRSSWWAGAGAGTSASAAVDEPLSALDLNYQFHVMRLLRQETAQHGLITVIVLHDLNVALQHADRAVMIHGGRLAAAGAPAEVITPASLAAVYGVQGRVEACSRGRLQVLIDDLEARPH